MATTEPRATSAGSLQETRATPPVAALQPHGRLLGRRRDPDHRARRGLLRLGRARQPVLRRPERAVLLNIGHGRQEVAQAGADQAGELEFFTNWSYAHPQAISSRPASPSSLPATSTASSSPAAASEAVESAHQAVAPVPQAQRQAAEQDEGHRPRDRLPRHDARRALRDRHHLAARSPSSRCTPGGCHVPNTNIYRLPAGDGPMSSPRRSASGSSSRAPTRSPR